MFSGADRWGRYEITAPPVGRKSGTGNLHSWGFSPHPRVLTKQKKTRRREQGATQIMVMVPYYWSTPRHTARVTKYSQCEASWNARGLERARLVIEQNIITGDRILALRRDQSHLNDAQRLLPRGGVISSSVALPHVRRPRNPRFEGVSGGSRERRLACRR